MALERCIHARWQLLCTMPRRLAPRAALIVCHALAAHNPSGQPNPRKIAFPYGSPKADQPWENESPTHECCDPVRTMHKTFVKDCTILRQNHDCFVDHAKEYSHAETSKRIDEPRKQHRRRSQ